MCKGCNHDKGKFELSEWRGWLLALGDRRYRPVAQLLDWIAEDDRDMQIEFAAGSGRGFARAQSDIRTGKTAGASRPQFVRKGPAPVVADLLAERETRLRVERTVHDVMTALELPRTHWTMQHPGKVRVLLGSLPEVFPVVSAIRLATDVANHARYKSRHVRRLAVVGAAT